MNLLCSVKLIKQLHNSLVEFSCAAYPYLSFVAISENAHIATNCIFKAYCNTEQLRHFLAVEILLIVGSHSHN